MSAEKISVLVHFHLISSGLSGILSSLEATEFPFFLDPLEGTETSIARAV
jgi:hypothetical protein